MEEKKEVGFEVVTKSGRYEFGSADWSVGFDGDELVVSSVHGGVRLYLGKMKRVEVENGVTRIYVEVGE